MISQAEENYLKCVYHLSGSDADKAISTNAISAAMNTSAASVTDMLKRLADKGLLSYVPYKGVNLTDEGEKIATLLIRKHRLWEVFLAEKLKMRWDEVHDIAEQLEHIQSPLLEQRLDEFLGFPRFDPHGDPIPDQHGNYSDRKDIPLSELKEGKAGIIVGVRDHSPEFLRYLGKQNLVLGCKVVALHKEDYDQNLTLQMPDRSSVIVSEKVAQQILVTPE